MQQDNLVKTLDTTTHTQKQEDEALEKLTSIVSADETPILHIKSVFPFDFFPNEVVIDKTKVTIIRKYFFFTRTFTTILIPDLLNVSVNHSVLFGALEISDRFFAQSPLKIEYLWKTEAHQAASIIQGLLLAHKERVDIMQIPTEKIAKEVDSAGLPEATNPASA